MHIFTYSPSFVLSICIFPSYSLFSTFILYQKKIANYPKIYKICVLPNQDGFLLRFISTKIEPMICKNHGFKEKSVKMAGKGPEFEKLFYKSSFIKVAMRTASIVFVAPNLLHMLCSMDLTVCTDKLLLSAISSRVRP